MTISRLASSLVSGAKKEAEEIIKIAEAEVNKLIAEEKAKRAILMKEAEGECERLLGEQKRERIAWGRLEAKRIIAEAKEDAIKNVIDQMYEMLGELKKTGEYAAFMKRAVAVSAGELGKGADIVLRVGKGDNKLIENFKGKVVEDLDAVGGLIAEKADGQVRVNLTLDSILESKKDDIRKRIYERLFEA